MNFLRVLSVASLLFLNFAASASAEGFQCLVPVSLPNGTAVNDVGLIKRTGDTSWLISTTDGFFRLDGSGPSTLASAETIPTEWNIQIVKSENDFWMITPNRKIHKIDVSELNILRAAGGPPDAGEVSDIDQVGDNVWLVGTYNALFHVDSSGVKELTTASGESIDGVFPIQKIENGVWLVGGGNRLFRFSSSGLTELAQTNGEPIGLITEIAEIGNDTWLIVGRDGVFRLRNSDLSELRLANGEKTGWASQIVKSGQSTWLIGAEAGLFRLDSTGLSKLSPANGQDLGWISLIVKFGDNAWLVGAEAGLFRLDSSGLTSLVSASNESTGSVRFLSGNAEGFLPIVGADGSAVLIAAENGLFRLEASSATPMKLADGVFSAGIGEIRANGAGVWLVTTDDGLIRVDDSGMTKLAVASGGPTGWINTATQDAIHGTWLIGSQNGLFRLAPAIDPTLLSNETRGDGLTAHTHLFEWRIKNPCAAAFPQTGLFGVRFNGGKWAEDVVVQPPEPGGPQDEVRIEWRHTLTVPDHTEVVAELGFRPDPRLDFEPIEGAIAHVQVGWTLWDYAADLARKYVPWALAGQTIVFGALLLLARRSRWAWTLVTDPLWGKVGIQFWTLLRFWPALQRWLLGRWLPWLREAYPAHPYLPMPLTRPANEPLMSTDLVSKLAPGKRIWLQGGAGMGKTVLISYAVSGYCAGNDSLRAAYARWGYIPVPIALRDFADINVPAAPEEWLFDLVGRQLDAAALDVEDSRLLRGIVAAGYLVLVLDGANEIDDHGAIQQFAQRISHVGMIVTSQTDPPPEAGRLFDLWRLPPDIKAAAKPLLALYLGEDAGGELWNALKGSPVMEDIQSGYDIRLLADLAEGGVAPDAIPRSRLGLYDAMLGRLRSTDGSHYPVALLCQVAWRAWIAGRRDLMPGDNISEDLLTPLREQDVRLVGTHDSTRWQFRHDQMRGYLAARWAAVEEVSPIDLFEKTASIWRLGRSEQRVVWEFFAGLVGAERGRNILDWAAQEVERAELQVALRHVAQRDGWLEKS